MEIYKSSLMEKFMNCKSKGMPYPEHRTKRIGTKTQMSILPQKFQAVFLRLYRIFFGVTVPQNFNMICQDFKMLALTRRGSYNFV